MYETRKRFCSRSCAAKDNNTKRTRSPNCKNCAKKTRSPSLIYCSATCKKEHVISQWLEGKLTGSTAHGHSNFVREYLLTQADYKCSQCGFSGVNPKTGNTILQVDHIDGNYLNNRVENLRVLCPNCHTMTETYGSLNGFGRGRRWKRQYKPFQTPHRIYDLERETGLEPATSDLEGRRSTIELLPQTVATTPNPQETMYLTGFAPVPSAQMRCSTD